MPMLPQLPSTLKGLQFTQLDSLMRCMTAQRGSWSNDNDALWNLYRCAGGYRIDYFGVVRDMQRFVLSIKSLSTLPPVQTLAQRRRTSAMAAIAMVAAEKKTVRRTA